MGNLTNVVNEISITLIDTIVAAATPCGRWEPVEFQLNCQLVTFAVSLRSVRPSRNSAGAQRASLRLCGFLSSLRRQ